jgi:hypothetical protein
MPLCWSQGFWLGMGVRFLEAFVFDLSFYLLFLLGISMMQLSSIHNVVF